MSMDITKNCIVCGKRAEVWCGHVIRYGKRITSGWCKKHLDDSIDTVMDKATGYCRDWKRKDGLTQHPKK
jgi:hypothetical protein